MKNFNPKNLILCAVSIFCLSVITGCGTDEDTGVVPSYMLEQTKVSFTSIDAYVSIDTEAPVKERGIVWSKEEQPTIDEEFYIIDNSAENIKLTNLNPGTTYFVRMYIKNNDDINYSEQYSIATMAIEDKEWMLTTSYDNGYQIFSKLIFNESGTVVFDEMDMPGHCPGCFVTEGTWTLDEDNMFRYIWEGNDPLESTYIYQGKLDEMSMTGTYTHKSAGSNVWHANPIE